MLLQEIVDHACTSCASATRSSQTAWHSEILLYFSTRYVSTLAVLWNLKMAGPHPSQQLCCQTCSLDISLAERQVLHDFSKDMQDKQLPGTLVWGFMGKGAAAVLFGSCSPVPQLEHVRLMLSTLYDGMNHRSCSISVALECRQPMLNEHDASFISATARH